MQKRILTSVILILTWWTYSNRCENGKKSFSNQQLKTLTWSLSHCCCRSLISSANFVLNVNFCCETISCKNESQSVASPISSSIRRILVNIWLVESNWVMDVRLKEIFSFKNRFFASRIHMRLIFTWKPSKAPEDDNVLNKRSGLIPIHPMDDGWCWILVHVYHCKQTISMEKSQRKTLDPIGNSITTVQADYWYCLNCQWILLDYYS